MTAATRWLEARGARGAIAAPHHLASEAGAAVLARGGTAVDAAVAAAATIAVVYPHMNSIGGDSFWLVFDGSRNELRALNAAGRSALGVDVEAYRRRGAIPTRGGAAALTVPGTIAGWWEAARFSREQLRSAARWEELLAPAIEHAREGFPPSPGQQRTTRAAPGLFDAGAPEEVRRSLWPIHHPERLGAGRFRQVDLANTLEEVARGGAEEFYRGALARRIAAGARAAGSPLAFEDLARHRAEWVTPLRVPYRGGEAASFPPPTQGVSALAILKLLEGFDVAGADDATLVHLAVEATKLAFEDRDRWLADPAAMTVPVERLLDGERLARRRARIRPDRAMPAGGPPGDGDTVALVTADGAGNAAVVIQSTYHEFGSGVVAGETGVLLQNRGAFFSLDPSHPNVLAPGKQTAHTLIPSMYLVGGRPRFVYGTMGGEGQPQTQAALVVRLVDRGLGPQAAVEAPRWLYGRTWGEESKALRLEARFSPETARALSARGHDVKAIDAWSDLVGHAQAIALDPEGLRAGSDPRADGAALGV